MTISIWPLIVAITGLLLYILAGNSKVQRIGEIMFFVGLLWTVYALSGKTVKIADSSAVTKSSRA